MADEPLDTPAPDQASDGRGGHRPDAPLDEGFDLASDRATADLDALDATAGEPAADPEGAPNAESEGVPEPTDTPEPGDPQESDIDEKFDATVIENSDEESEVELAEETEPPEEFPRTKGAPGPDEIRLRLDLSYEGTEFAGWARQPGLRTVQGVLEDSLTRVLRLTEPARLTVAGRTDAGVHARGQVVHFDCPNEAWFAAPGRSDRSPGDALIGRLAGVLPPDVQVHRCVEAEPGFDARFGALYRRYCYRIADHPDVRDPLTRRQVLWHKRQLDVDAMARAAEALLGEHDFAAYCRPREGATTIRTLHLCQPVRRDDGGVEVWVQADAFCHNMVRALVGALVTVGDYRNEERWPGDVLAAGVRDPGCPVLPGHGLTLEEVAYPEGEDLVIRVLRARKRRG